MILEELLDHTAKDLLDDRTDLVDGEPDSLFSDEVIVRYLAAAEERLCRRAWALVDIGHAQAGVLTLVEGKTLYTLHPSVLRVLTATPTDEEFPLHRTTDARLVAYRGESPDYFDVNASDTIAPGRPLAFTTDAGTRRLRLFRTPSADEAGLKLVLQIARLPVCKLDVAKVKESPEVDAQWHLDMCNYAAGKCLLHPNVDSQQRADGKRMVDDFERAVRECRQERERAWHAEPRPQFSSSTARCG